MVSRTLLIVIAVTAAISIAVGATVWAVTMNASATKKSETVPISSVVVTKTTLSSIAQLNGTLGHGATYAVLYQGRGGTLTRVPDLGTVVQTGQELFEVDGTSTFLFYGLRPEWRDLRLGVAPGSDIRQLEENLTTLGYTAGLTMTIDNTFTAATRRALERWQRAVGAMADGQLHLGSVSYLPGPVRVEQSAAELGSLLGTSVPVITVDSALVSVTADVPTSQTHLVHSGDKVTVILPSGATVGGVIGLISRVATDSASSQSSAGQRGNEATIPASVTLDDPAAVGALDEAPVTVNVTDQTVEDVLAVPITALVALSGGGYGLYVVRGQSKKLIAATPGLFSATLVQITATGLSVGDRVQVPSS